MWASQVWEVVRKDFLLEARSRAHFNAMLFFALMILLIFSFALGPSAGRLRAAAGGLLWLAFIFSGLLAFGQMYQAEAENDAFEGLLLIAQSRSAIYAGKVLAVALMMLVIEAIVAPVMALLYDLNLWSALPTLFPIALLGTLGFAAIGALYGALTMSLRAREVLLPLLLLPVTVPVILGAVKASTIVLTSSHESLTLWFSLLVAYDLIFLTAGLLIYEYAVGE
jgi:heme exporter protein B